METPYSKALAEYKSTPEFKRAVDAQSLGAEGRESYFLDNRLEAAFAAGWSAAGVDRDSINLETDLIGQSLASIEGEVRKIRDNGLIIRSRVEWKEKS